MISAFYNNKKILEAYEYTSKITINFLAMVTLS